LHALPKHLQLDDAQGPLDAQDQLVIQVIQVIDLLLVADERAEDLAHLHEAAPVLVRAREPGDLSTDDDAHFAQRHRTEDALESFAASGADRGAGAQIVTDDFHLAPAQGLHALAQVILQALALLVLPYLFVRGLPEVDDGLAGQVLRFDLGTVQQLGHRRSFPLLERRSPASEP
jgi:hypothetical protein